MVISLNSELLMNVTKTRY